MVELYRSTTGKVLFDDYPGAALDTDKWGEKTYINNVGNATSATVSNSYGHISSHANDGNWMRAKTAYAVRYVKLVNFTIQEEGKAGGYDHTYHNFWLTQSTTAAAINNSVGAKIGGGGDTGYGFRCGTGTGDTNIRLRKLAAGTESALDDDPFAYVTTTAYQMVLKLDAASGLKLYINGTLECSSADTANVGDLAFSWGDYADGYTKIDAIIYTTSNTITVVNLLDGQKFKVYDALDNLVGTSGAASGGSATLDTFSSDYVAPFQYIIVTDTDGLTPVYTMGVGNDAYGDIWGGDIYAYGALPTQSHFRWYMDNAAESPTVLRAEDTTLVAVNTTGDSLRLRLAGSADDTVNGWAFKLQYQAGSTAGAWSDVGAKGGAGILRYYDGKGSDQGLITTVLLTDSDTPEHFVEASPTNTMVELTNGTQGEWDFSIQTNGVAEATTYYFRLVENTYELAFTAYDVYPALTTIGTNYVTFAAAAWSAATNKKAIYYLHKGTNRIGVSPEYARRPYLGADQAETISDLVARARGKTGRYLVARTPWNLQIKPNTKIIIVDSSRQSTMVANIIKVDYRNFWNDEGLVEYWMELTLSNVQEGDLT